MSVDFKGPMGGKFFYLVVLENYSQYLEVPIVPDIKFSMLKPVLEEIWSRWGYPDKIIHDRGPSYNSHKWQRYIKDIEVEMH